jgi:hypothetical protein
MLDPGVRAAVLFRTRSPVRERRGAERRSRCDLLNRRFGTRFGARRQSALARRPRGQTRADSAQFLRRDPAPFESCRKA